MKRPPAQKMYKDVLEKLYEEANAKITVRAKL